MRFRNGKTTVVIFEGRADICGSLAFFYILSVLVGGFSNILAYGLMQMEGVGGQRGWQWIFVRISTPPVSIFADHMNRSSKVF